MAALASVRAVVYGLVQGVYFRAFILRHAEELGLAGYVRNLPDGSSVMVEAERERGSLQRLIAELHRGPRGADVKRVEASWQEYQGSFTSFGIQR